MQFKTNKKKVCFPRVSFKCAACCHKTLWELTQFSQIRKRTGYIFGGKSTSSSWAREPGAQTLKQNCLALKGSGSRAEEQQQRNQPLTRSTCSSCSCATRAHALPRAKATLMLSPPAWTGASWARLRAAAWPGGASAAGGRGSPSAARQREPARKETAKSGGRSPVSPQARGEGKGEGPGRARPGPHQPPPGATRAARPQQAAEQLDPPQPQSTRRHREPPARFRFRFQCLAAASAASLASWRREGRRGAGRVL